MERNNQSQQRDMMFCHQCENEWYRDEHGLTCPECQSDFTEIIEPEHDPRDQDMQPDLDAGLHNPLRDHDPWNAPDPDEDDIEAIQWRRGDDGYMHGNTRIRRNVTLEWPPRGGQQDQGQALDGLMGTIGRILGGAAQLRPQQQRDTPSNPQSPGMEPAGPGSAPNQGPGSPQSEQARSGTFHRHITGNGYSFTVTQVNTGGGNLLPRNANGPQPFQEHPDNLQNMLSQIFANIGVVPGPGGVGMAPAGAGLDDGDMFGPPPMNARDVHGPFGGIFQMLGPMMLGGRHGDAVFSQEELDRVVTQLMEQHNTGNAPGPATEQAIKSLPSRQITEADLDVMTGKADCSICMDATPVGATVTVLPCSHWFHFDCIEAWLKEHDTCPHCRQGIMPKSPQGENNASARESSQPPLHDMRSPAYAGPVNVPGSYPFPRQNSGDGSASHTFGGPDSSTLNRSTSDTGRGSRQNSSGSGLFRSMREAFGSGRNSGGDGPHGPGGNRS